MIIKDNFQPDEATNKVLLKCIKTT